MTFATVRRKTERIREFSAFPFLLITAVSLGGAFFRAAPQKVVGGPINAGDVAWMLTATGLVLLMTPGLSFFYGGMVRTKNVVSTMLQSFVAMAVISILWIVVGFSPALSIEVCHHHAGTDHRIVRGAGAIHELPPFHVSVQRLHLFAARALDVAPGRVPAQDGRA